MRKEKVKSEERDKRLQYISTSLQRELLCLHRRFIFTTDDQEHKGCCLKQKKNKKKRWKEKWDGALTVNGRKKNGNKAGGRRGVKS